MRPEILAALIVMVAIPLWIAVFGVPGFGRRWKGAVARPPSRAFRCPGCGAHRLVITATLDLPGDMLEDEINLQAIACRRCAFVGVAVYCESRQGRLDADHWSHMGYRMRQADYDELQAAIGRCPTQA